MLWVKAANRDVHKWSPKTWKCLRQNGIFLTLLSSGNRAIETGGKALLFHGLHTSWSGSRTAPSSSSSGTVNCIPVNIQCLWREWPMVSNQDSLCVSPAVTGVPCRLCRFQGGSLDLRTCLCSGNFVINETLFLCCSILTLLKILITDRLSQPHQLYNKSATTQINTF